MVTASHVTATQVKVLLVLKVLGAKGPLGHPLPRKLAVATDNQIAHTLFQKWFEEGHRRLFLRWPLGDMGRLAGDDHGGGSSEGI